MYKWMACRKSVRLRYAQWCSSTTPVVWGFKLQSMMVLRIFDGDKLSSRLFRLLPAAIGRSSAFTEHLFMFQAAIVSPFAP